MVNETGYEKYAIQEKENMDTYYLLSTFHLYLCEGISYALQFLPIDSHAIL